MAESSLTGRYWVRATRPAFADARRLSRRAGELMLMRRHALKLRFWPDSPPSVGGTADLDWEWAKGLRTRDVGELRISDTIAGCDNLRIIFHVGGALREGGLPCIWILRVFQKKRNDFSAADLEIFRQRRRDVRRLFYGE